MEVFDQQEFQNMNIIMNSETTAENAFGKIRGLSELLAKAMRMSNTISAMNRRGLTEDKGIMEHRLIRDLKTFTGDKREYRNWNEKLINAYVQIKKGSRGIFEWIREQVEKGVKDMDQLKDAWDVEEFSDRYEFDGFGEELYCILMDKCEGEALTKIRTAHEGQGIGAYFALHKWYSETTGEAISERIKQVVTLASPKQESEIASPVVSEYHL